uniref:Uncharacterized protein n=1 Tax=Lynx canadensis TaxID=61383 RepID=A0A667HE23_LYNCA
PLPPSLCHSFLLTCIFSLFGISDLLPSASSPVHVAMFQRCVKMHQGRLQKMYAILCSLVVLL